MKEWIKGRYGSRKGLVELKWHQLLYRLGRYQRYEVNWGSIERLVFVCSGNICRSAFAEAVAKFHGMESISVGIHATQGVKADPRAISVGKRLGYHLDNHRTTQIMYPSYTEKDLFLAMEPWQANFAQEHLAKRYSTTLLGMWGDPIQPYIHDPYTSSERYFLNCFKYIEVTVNAVIEKIRTLN